MHGSGHGPSQTWGTQPVCPAGAPGAKLSPEAQLESANAHAPPTQLPRSLPFTH
jgi:hypothetical protein